MSRDFPIYHSCPLPDVSGSKEMRQWSERDLADHALREMSAMILLGLQRFKLQKRMDIAKELYYPMLGERSLLTFRGKEHDLNVNTLEELYLL